MKFSADSKNLFEVFFPINKNIFLYGKKPKISGEITPKNSDVRELNIWKEQQATGEYEKMQNEEANHPCFT